MREEDEIVKRTVDYYDKKAELWAFFRGNRKEVYPWRLQIKEFHRLLPKGNIIEIGSGVGKEAFLLISLGYNYTGIDASKNVLKLAKQRNPAGKFFQVAVNDLNFPEKEFDGFWTTATLIHIPKSRIDDAMERIRRMLKPRAIGFIGIKSGSGEENNLKTGRWLSYYSQQEFREVLIRNNFSIIKEGERQGVEELWLYYFVRK
jgi:SAM-dependent methyltransferase